MSTIRHELGDPFGIKVMALGGAWTGVVTSGPRAYLTERVGSRAEALEAARAHPAYRHILSVEAHTGNFRKKFQKVR